jgi:hypothetical protein
MSRRMVAPGVWVDEQPSVATARYKRGDGFACLTVGDMQPVVTAGGLMAMSPHGGARDTAFHIRRDVAWIVRPSRKMKERRWLDKITAPTPRVDGTRRRLETSPRCGYLMPKIKERCARTAGHSTETNGKGHRSGHDLDGRAARKRARTA